VEVVLERERCRARSRRHADLGEDVGEVSGHSLGAEEELAGDLAVRESSGDEPQDLDLSRRKAGWQGRFAVSEDLARVEPGTDLVEQPDGGLE
jgi:hypothetical protein